MCREPIVRADSTIAINSIRVKATEKYRTGLRLCFGSSDKLEVHFNPLLWAFLHLTLTFLFLFPISKSDKQKYQALPICLATTVMVMRGRNVIIVNN